MQFALNYSPQAAALVQAGQIEIDLFKCPPWLELVTEAQATWPVYIHFGLKVGRGSGEVANSGDKRSVDWAEVEYWLASTDTPFINLHLEATSTSYPGIRAESVTANDAEQVRDAYCLDVQAAVSLFGPERVIVENNHGNNGKALAAGILPGVIRGVVEATGCGFLFDISHARLAARRLGMNEYDYAAQLPLEHTREIHVTGLQRFGSPWAERMQANGVEEERILRYEGRLLDHLPLTAADWEVMDWAAAELRQGKWGQPNIIAIECGGTGPLWQALTDIDALASQTPRLRALFCSG